MNEIVAATGRDKRRVNDRPRYDRLLVVIAPLGATTTSNGIATAGHAESHAWGDCVSHQRLRATMQRSPNQESHGVSRVECQSSANEKNHGYSRGTNRRLLFKDGIHP